MKKKSMVDMLITAVESLKELGPLPVIYICIKYAKDGPFRFNAYPSDLFVNERDWLKFRDQLEPLVISHPTIDFKPTISGTPVRYGGDQVYERRCRAMAANKPKKEKTDGTKRR